MSLFRKFTSMGAVLSFLGSPTGQKLITKATDAATDPRTRARAAEFARKLRGPANRRP